MALKLHQSIISIFICLFANLAIANQDIGQKAEAFSVEGISPVKSVPFISLRKSINSFYTDCRNLLREPQIEWNQIEVLRFHQQKILQVKISGKINEDIEAFLWSKIALRKDRTGNNLPSINLAFAGKPLRDENSEFQISINMPQDTGELIIPIEFKNSMMRFRYKMKLKLNYSDISVVAYPILDVNNMNFCTRELQWLGWGVSGTAQNQKTSPIEANLNLQSFNMDDFSYERRWNYRPLLGLRTFVNTNTLNITPFLDTKGSKRIYQIGSEVFYSKLEWAKSNSLFRIQYGLTGGLDLEQRPFAIVKSASAGGISEGLHLSMTGGGYAEFYSKKSDHYAEVSMRLHPLYFGINHKYSGIGLSGQVGFAKALSYDSMIGIYSYGRMFSGKHIGDDGKDSSNLFIFQTQLELRYGWLF